MPALPQELFGLYEKTGDRQIYDGFYLTRRKYLAVTGLLALAEKRDLGYVPKEHIEKLSYIMEEICQEECWAVPAHVDRTRRDWRVTADLFACETAQTLSELSDRLAGELPLKTRDMVIKNVERRVFAPFFSGAGPACWWEGCNTNWNAVCTGCIGSACLHLLRGEKARLEECLERVIRALVHYIDGFAEDGICLEGMGYYTYGMTYFVNFAQELWEYSGKERDLFTGEWNAEIGKRLSEKIAKIAGALAKCFFQDGKILCFSDDSSQDTYRMGMCCVLAMHFDNLDFPPVSQAAGLHSDFCYRFAGLKMDLLYPAGYLEKFPEDIGSRSIKHASFHVFPKAQWCIANSAFGTGFACKGGSNGEAHNHNDIGHFIYEKDKILFLTDLGAGEYNNEYFGEKRYSILCNSSLGHSVPLICRAQQCAGAQYRCRGFWADETGTNRSSEGHAEGKVRMELQDAYPTGLLKNFVREFRFDLQTGALQVDDLFEFPGHSQLPVSSGAETTAEVRSGAEIAESLVTQIEPIITDRGVLLEKDGVRVVISFAEPALPALQVCRYVHKNPKGRPEDVYAIRWPLTVNDRKAACSFTVTSEA